MSVCGLSPAVEGDARLGGVLLQLVVGAGSERVGTHQTRAPALLHVVVRHLGAGCGLSRTLQADEHDDIWLSLGRCEWFDARVHQLQIGEKVVRWCD